VAGDETVSIGDLAEEIGRILGRAPIYAEGSGTAAGDIVCDNSRMRRSFGLEGLVPVSAGLEETIRGCVGVGST
jgi:nucleoside-diphosphate-sugar epimerase